MEGRDLMFGDEPSEALCVISTQKSVKNGSTKVIVTNHFNKAYSGTAPPDIFMGILRNTPNPLDSKYGGFKLVNYEEELFISIREYLTEVADCTKRGRMRVGIDVNDMYAAIVYINVVFMHKCNWDKYWQLITVIPTTSRDIFEKNRTTHDVLLEVDYTINTTEDSCASILDLSPFRK